MQSKSPAVHRREWQDGLIWFVLFIWLIWFIWFLWFVLFNWFVLFICLNQTNPTDKTNQITIFLH